MRFEKGVDFYEFIKENVFFEEKCRLVNFYNCNNFKIFVMLLWGGERFKIEDYKKLLVFLFRFLN